MAQQAEEFPDRSALHIQVTTALKDRLDQLAERTGIPQVRIVESLLRDDLAMPPMFPGMAEHVRKTAGI